MEDDFPTPDDPLAAKPRKRKGPRKATAKSLENAALHYLERFATSRENLRRVLMRRVERSVRHHGTDRDEGARFIDDIIAKLEGLGLLDDRAYSEMRVRGLRRRGQSSRAVRASLMQKGVDSATIDDTLDTEEDDEGTGDPELTAAITLARKRRLGPYRPEEARKDNREKDLATLARAGFSYDMALRVVDAETVEDLEPEF